MQPSPALAAAALEAKALAERNRTRRNLVLLGFVLAGVLLPAGVLALTGASASTASTLLPFTVGAAAGLGTLANGLLVHVITPVLARCPSCSHPWEIKEGRRIPLREQMPSWDRCPGCGLAMRMALLRKIASAPP